VRNNGRIITGDNKYGSVRVEARSAFRVFWVCGLASVLVDIDHIVRTFPQYHWVQGRIWHAPLFALSCLIICYMGSRVGGLHHKLVLVAVVMITVSVLIFSSWVNWGIAE
jgi:hypothetical protein